MNYISEQKLAMLIRVYTHLVKNAAVYTEDSRIEISVSELQDRIKRIQELSKVTYEEDHDPPFVSDERKGLEHIMAKIAAAVRSYGVNTNDRTLQNKVNYSLKDIQYWRDSRLHFNALRLSEIADPLLKKLTDYRVETTDLNNLVHETGAYFGRIREEKDDFRPVAHPKAELARQFRLADYLLNRLDYWMEDVKETDPGVWDEYCNTRLLRTEKSNGKSNGKKEQHR
jgi:hypothetical protein